MGTLVLAYIAGLVTLLSPCVLPLLPIILYGVLNEHKKGPLLLSLGLVVSFTSFGFLLATIGHSIGLSQDLLRQIAGSALVFFGIILLISPFYQKFSANASHLTGGLNNYISQIEFKGLWGQFLLGLVLGLIWAPCIGPTLGAAISLAAQGESLLLAFLTMLIFSIGTVTPLLILSRLSFPSINSWKAQITKANKYLKPTMALIFIIVGLLFLTGYVFRIEAAILELLPIGFVQFITKF